MSDLTKQLKSFEKRVRLVRAWRGLAVGAFLGAVISSVWSVLDWRSVVYTEWAWMVMLTAAAAIVGGLIGLFRKVPAEQLAESIDRRAGLNDRLTTANERSASAESFDSALRLDAQEQLASILPKRIYPIRLSRWHAGALGFGALAAAIFVLGNTPVALSEEAKKDRAELKRQAENIKRVTKENFETPDAQQEMSAAEKKLADEMRRFDRDLEKAHLNKEEALQKSNELAQKADELMKEAAKSSEQSMAQAETARDQLMKGELEKAGLENMSPQMAQMSDGQRQEMMDRAKQERKNLDSQLQSLQRQLDEINKKLSNPNLSAKERSELEAKKKELEKQIAELNKLIKQNSDLQKALDLSKEAKAVFQKMMQDPLFKELMEIEKKLAQDAKEASKSGHPKLTDEERKRLKEQLEKLAAQLKDPKAMKEYLEALLEAMKRAKRLGRCNGAGLGINGLPGLMPAPAGPGSPTEDIWHGDNGQIHKLDKPEASRGTTTTDVISGEQRPASGPMPYVEIKAPSLVGNRSSVPYKEVLPSYQKKAESALNRQQIPKEHQKRVKEYFDSLTGANRH